MKKKFIKFNKFLILIILFIFISFTTFSELKNIGPCTSWILTSENGAYISGENISQVHPLASITKMMNACVAFSLIKEKKISLFDTKATVSKNALKYKGSSAYLKSGQKVTLFDLLCGMIVPSGNDAAYELAWFLSDENISNFVSEMNQMAKNIGMNNTNFYTPDGLPSNMTGKKMDVSTVEDISKLAARLVKNQVFLSISSKKKVLVYNGKVTLFSVNTLLGKVKGLDGLKTGHHDEAKYNMAVTAKRGKMRLIAVVFGAPSQKERDQDAKNILEQGFNQCINESLGKSGETVNNIKIKNGKLKTLALVLKNDLNITIEKGMQSKLKDQIQLTKNIKTPINKGDKLGEIVIYYKGQKIATDDLLAIESVGKLGIFGKILRIVSFGVL